MSINVARQRHFKYSLYMESESRLLSAFYNYYTPIYKQDMYWYTSKQSAIFTVLLPTLQTPLSYESDRPPFSSQHLSPLPRPQAPLRSQNGP